MHDTARRARTGAFAPLLIGCTLALAIGCDRPPANSGGTPNPMPGNPMPGQFPPGGTVPEELRPDGMRAAPRDGFQVLDNPAMAKAADAKKLPDEEWVIGVTIGGEAKAYPLSVMGMHELANDTCGGKQIAVSW